MGRRPGKIGEAERSFATGEHAGEAREREAPEEDRLVLSHELLDALPRAGVRLIGLDLEAGAGAARDTRLRTPAGGRTAVLGAL